MPAPRLADLGQQNLNSFSISLPHCLTAAAKRPQSNRPNTQPSVHSLYSVPTRPSNRTLSHSRPRSFKLRWGEVRLESHVVAMYPLRELQLPKILTCFREEPTGINSDGYFPVNME